MALFRSRAADHIYRAVSYDYGESWEPPQALNLPNNNSSISAIRLHSGTLAMVYNAVAYNDQPDITVWPYQRYAITLALSEDEGLSWPWRRMVELGEGWTGEKNDQCNCRYEYPVMMQGPDDVIHLAYSWKNRRCIKYVRIAGEDWIRGNS